MARAFRRDALVVFHGLSFKESTCLLSDTNGCRIKRELRGGIGDGMEPPTCQAAARDGGHKAQDRLPEVSWSYVLPIKSSLLSLLRLPRNARLRVPQESFLTSFSDDGACGQAAESILL